MENWQSNNLWSMTMRITGDGTAQTNSIIPSPEGMDPVLTCFHVSWLPFTETQTNYFVIYNEEGIDPYIKSFAGCVLSPNGGSFNAVVNAPIFYNTEARLAFFADGVIYAFMTGYFSITGETNVVRGLGDYPATP
jgi:hypothetical protein